MNVVLRAAAAATALLLTACSATGYAIGDLAEEINATLGRAQTTITIGDSLSVRFVEKPDWNTTARVRADGVAVFPLIDEVKVVGLTLPQLDQKLTQAYETSTLVYRGGISVDFSTGTTDGVAPGAGVVETVYVIGDVENPGPMAMPGRPLTLIEAISAAGGHRKATANLGNTFLIRRVAEGTIRSWRLDADVYGWGQVPPIWLQASDIVWVPNTAVDEVAIWIDNYIRRMIPFPTLYPTVQ